MVAATVGKAALGYAGQTASFLGKSLNFLGKGFTHNFTATTRQFVTSGKGETAKLFWDNFTGEGGWQSYAAAGAISIPTAAMNFANFFDDGRRMREIASGQSNFHTDRNAATKTWALSGLGLAGSATLGLSGLAMGAASATPLGLGLTVASGVLATGSLLARHAYKRFTIDMPFQANAGFGLASLNRPVFRVEDPSSPYYMMSHMQEKTVKNRELQDKKYGQLGDDYIQQVEKLGLNLTGYLMA